MRIFRVVLVHVQEARSWAPREMTKMTVTRLDWHDNHWSDSLTQWSLAEGTGAMTDMSVTTDRARWTSGLGTAVMDL
jgi:hypothetical protein